MNQTSRKKAPARAKSLILEKWGEPTEYPSERLPLGFAEIHNTPERAFVWGALPPPPWVSIVGTRDPSPQGGRDAFHLARRLARAGVTIASGGARGIDTAAHLGAIAGGGVTIVIAPTWLPYAYPANNHQIFQRILGGGGAYLTVADESTRPMKFAFFKRNEVLMALSHATVLGECPHQSGARNAMLHARRLGRPRFALPFRFGDKRAQGLWAEILQHGAELIADETPVVRLLEEYGEFANPVWQAYLEAGPTRVTRQEAGIERASANSASTDSRASKEGAGSSAQRPNRSRGFVGGRVDRFCESRSDAEKRVLRAVLRGEVTVDGLCDATELPPEEVQHVVLLLTLSGEVVEDDQGLLRYQNTSVVNF